MIKTRAEGFGPVFDAESRLLILGSFPSVKSRAVSFYYGNPQNRFWKTVCGFFGQTIPADTDGKRNFLLARHIALWDVVESCTVCGSSDASIEDAAIADIPSVLNAAPVKKIFCNGSKAYGLFTERFPQYIEMTQKLPSTSPANPRFSEETWKRALSEALCP